MNKNLLTIEDCLETLTGLSSNDKFEIDSNDKTIINSIARQVFKGTALTDRQFLLMKEKLSSYFEQFLSNNYTGHENAIHELRQPLREIDRSKFIKEAVKKESSMVITNKISKNLSLKKQIKVRNSLKFLTECALNYRNNIKTTIIGITGSCGKTTLKKLKAAS